MKALFVQKVLYVLLIAASVGFYIFDILVNHTNPTENIFRVVLVVVCCIIGMFRSNQRGRTSLSFYETQYANELRDAFVSDKKDRKKLICAARFYNEDKPDKAIRLLNELKSKCRRQNDFYAVGLFTGLCFTEMQLYENAINEYQQLLTRRLENGTIYNNLGHIYGRLGKKEDAMNYYNRAISRYPENESAYVNVANLYFADKEFDKAIEYADKALQINCKQLQAANLMAIVYALKGDKENGDKFFHLAKSCGSDPKELKKAIEYFKTQP